MNSRFAFQIQPNNPRFSYPEHFHQIYRAFYQQQTSIDIISPNADLSSYKLILAPALHLVTGANCRELEALRPGRRYVSRHPAHRRERRIKYCGGSKVARLAG